MKNFLGEFPVNISIHPVYSKYTPSDWAMFFVERYGQIDGSHHKQWVLDQVARCLKGVPIVIVEARWGNGKQEYRITTSKEESKEYLEWVKDMHWYEYDKGIAP